MKNLTDIKIKINLQESKTFLHYLNELIKNFEQYSKPLELAKTFNDLLFYHLENLRDNLMKFLFNKRGQPGDKSFIFTIDKAERLTLYKITTFYPLPSYLSTLDYSIKNGLYL